MYLECACAAVNDLQHVCISQEHVEQELTRLSSMSENVSPTSLSNLQLVTDFLSDPSLPSSPHNRSYAISNLLTRVISDSYIAQRRIFRLNEEEEPKSYDAAITMIADDARIGSSELNGWSYLYYRYVRVELNISRTRLIEIFSVDERTLSRRKNNAIGRLTMKIIQAEHQARKIAYNMQLYQHKRDPEIIKDIAAMEVRE